MIPLPRVNPPPYSSDKATVTELNGYFVRLEKPQLKIIAGQFNCAIASV